MSDMTNITIKKNDGTTDVVYTALVPSSGDKNAAIWRNLTVGSAASHRPQLALMSMSNGPRTARRCEAKYTYPSLATGTDGKVNVVDKVIIEFQALIPNGMADSDVGEAVSQAFNLFVATLIKDSVKSGYAPT